MKKNNIPEVEKRRWCLILAQVVNKKNSEEEERKIERE
jgi:hypothetical protein